MVCGAVLLTVMQGLDCTVGTYGCWCLYSNRLGDNRIFSGEKYRYQAWTSDGVNVFCEGIVMAHRVEVGNGTWGFTREQFVDDHYARGLCDSENLSPEDLVDIDSYISSNWIYAARNCSLYSDLPGMLREPCQLGAVDIVRFRQCRDGLAGLSSFFSGTCDGRFTVCAAFTDSMTPEKLRVVIYISLPMCALCVLLVAHILAQMLNCSLMDVEENRTLRKQVNQKTRVYLEQLQNGHLEYSVLIGRVMLSGKVAFFLLDVIMDIVCVSTLFLSGSLQFAICQLLVLMVSMCLQVRQTRCGDIRQTLVESWKKGMASNALQRILLEEKTFEAPLSLFLQFFSAFYVAGDDWAFTNLWFSMLLSSIGVATGLYTSNHLSAIDLDEDEDPTQDMSPKVMGVSTPSFHPIGQPQVLPPPPGMTPTFRPLGPQVLPPPPGLAPKPGAKRPGQFASATE